MKKMLSAIFAVMLLIFILVSCGDGSGTTVATTGSNNPGNPDASGASAEAAASTLPEFQPAENADYGGYNFRILDYAGVDKATWYAGTINEIAVEEENGDPINDALYQRNKEVETLYNVKISNVPVSDLDPTAFSAVYKKSILAADDAFDAAFIPPNSIPTAINAANMAYDLTQIPSLDLSKSWWDQNSEKSLSIGNKLYAVIGDINLYTDFATEAIYANKQLMQEYSIDNLYQLVRDGKWTWDAMYDVMKRVSKDLNGDGVIDQQDQVGLEIQGERLNEAVSSSGEYITPKNKDDIPELTTNVQRIAGVVSKYGTIVNDSTVTLKSEKIKGTFGNVYYQFILPKFINNEIMFHFDQMYFTFELRNMQSDFALLPYPKYDESQPDYHSTMSNWWGKATVIPTTCSDTERTGNILGAMGYYSQKYVTPAFYDVSITNKLMRDEDSLEMLNIILKSRIYDVGIIYNWGKILDMFNALADSGSEDTFMSKFDGISDKITAAIQKTLSELELA